MFDLILQNNASKELHLFTGLENTSDTNLFCRFNLNLDALRDGEYTYWLIFDGREDVTFDLNEVPLESVLHTEDGDVKLKDLKPKTGFLRIGQPVNSCVSRENTNKTEYLYR